MHRGKKNRNLAQIVRRPTSVSLADELSRLLCKVILMGSREFLAALKCAVFLPGLSFFLSRYMQAGHDP